MSWFAQKKKRRNPGNEISWMVEYFSFANDPKTFKL